VPSKKALLYVLPIAFLIAYLWFLPEVYRQSTRSRSDFIEWWSASAMVLHGSPASAYDNLRLWAAQKKIAGYNIGFTPFPYPPTYLLIIAPLALLPYLWSQAVWSILWIIAYLLVMSRIEKRGLLLALAFPGVFLNFIFAQNGLLTLVLIGAGILCLDTWPTAAGALFGLCTYKPQLAVLIPLFLCITKRWRALAASAASAVLFCLLAWAAFGWQTWAAFLHSTHYTRTIVLEHGAPGWEKFQTLFAAARIWGFSVEASYIIHFSVAALAAGAAMLVWKRSGVIELQATALVLATMLLTPHLLEYDVVLLALPIAWLAVDGLHSRFLPGEVLVLAALWLSPAVMRSFATRGLPLTTVLMAAGMILCLRHSLQPALRVHATRPGAQPQYQPADAVTLTSYTA